MYQIFQKVINFEINERAAGTDNEQQRFRALQVRARDGNSNLEDWNMLLLRQPQNVVNIDTFQKSAVNFPLVMSRKLSLPSLMNNEQ